LEDRAKQPNITFLLKLEDLKNKIVNPGVNSSTTIASQGVHGKSVTDQLLELGLRLRLSLAIIMFSYPLVSNQ
jgi:hypothetical protein